MLASLALSENKKKKKMTSGVSLEQLTGDYENLRSSIAHHGTAQNYIVSNECSLTKAASMDNELHTLLFGNALFLPVFVPEMEKGNST